VEIGQTAALLSVTRPKGSALFPRRRPHARTWEPLAVFYLSSSPISPRRGYGSPVLLQLSLHLNKFGEDGGRPPCDSFAKYSASSAVGKYLAM